MGMILFGPPPKGYDHLPFRYTLTDHRCPECDRLLTKVDVSTMLTCDQGHGPYFLT